MKRSLLVTGAVLAIASLVTATAYAQPATTPQSTPARPAATAAKAAPLSVTVTYKGKGTVGATKDIMVFLFNTPEVNGSSEPIAFKSIPKNGGTATFDGLPEGPIYVYTMHDQVGDYTGTEGPPPVGTPIGVYSTSPKGEPTAVKAGAKVKMTFDDSRLWK